MLYMECGFDKDLNYKRKKHYKFYAFFDNLINYFPRNINLTATIPTYCYSLFKLNTNLHKDNVFAILNIGSYPLIS